MDPVHGRLELQGLAEPDLIGTPAELVAQSGQQLDDPGARGIRGELQAKQEPVNPGMGALSLVPVDSGDGLGPVERGPRLPELPYLGQGGAEARVEPRQGTVIGRQQRGRAG